MVGEAKPTLRCGNLKDSGGRLRRTAKESGTLQLLRRHLEHIRHSAELRKRPRFHLPHQMGAMYLHGRFRDTDIAGNLLVEATGRDLNHDFALAGAERVETLSERLQDSITLPTGTV